MNRLGYYLRSFERPWTILAFVFVDVGAPPRIGQHVQVEGTKGFVDEYDVIVPAKV